MNLKLGEFIGYVNFGRLLTKDNVSGLSTYSYSYITIKF